MGKLRNLKYLPTGEGVYLIKNSANGFVYVGVSKHLRIRVSEHLSELTNGNHANKSLQRDWREYGESNFLFEVAILSTDPFQLRATEQRLIDEYGARGLLYNGKVVSDYQRAEKFNLKQAKNITLTADQDFYNRSNRAVKRLGFLSLRDFIFSKLKDAIAESDSSDET